MKPTAPWNPYADMDIAFMSIPERVDILRWLTGEGWFTPAGAAVMKELAMRQGQNTSVWTSVTTLARETGFSERCVRSTLRLLRETHLLVAQERRGRSTHYSLTLPSGPVEPGSGPIPLAWMPMDGSPRSKRLLADWEREMTSDAGVPLHLLPGTPAPPAPESLIESLSKSLFLRNDSVPSPPANGSQEVEP